MDFHQPVLLPEVIKLLSVAPGKTFLDATLGNGGHSLEILKGGGIVFGLDQDPVNLKIATDRITKSGFKDNFHPIHGNFSTLPKIVSQFNNLHFDGLLLDLGLSSGQQKSTGRGFSFNDQKSLDMRLDPNTNSLTAENVINTYDFDQLYDIFSRLAQETYSKPLVIKIIKERQQQPIVTASRLAAIIRDFYTQKGIRSRIDPATKIFLALRIHVNREMENLTAVLTDTLITPQFSKAVVCIISFHSGEDRLVKRFIQRQVLNNKILNLTPKAIVPSRPEIVNNPLSRSAVLRSYKIIT